MNRLLLLALLLGPVVLPDLAQAASADSDAPNIPGLDEIIVSAEKRQVDLESAPVAITVVTAADLDHSTYRSWPISVAASRG